MLDFISLKKSGGLHRPCKINVNARKCRNWFLTGFHKGHMLNFECLSIIGVKDRLSVLFTNNPQSKISQSRGSIRFGNYVLCYRVVYKVCSAYCTISQSENIVLTKRTLISNLDYII